MKSWTIVFDLDGTLVDTAPDLAAATNHVLMTLGLAPVDDRQILPFVGHGARAMIDAATAARGAKLSEPDLQAAFDTFIAHYGDNIAVRSQIYPGVVAALDQLDAEGATLAVCTNKTEALARKLLTALGLSDRFAALTGGDSLVACKPDPRHLIGTILRAGGNERRAIMVGDSETDIKTARAAAVPVVAVSFGYSVAPVASFNPDVLIDHYEHLGHALQMLSRNPSQC